MRIGIATFYNTQDNYGALLQAFASTSYLKEIGHDPFIIGYSEMSEPTPTLWERFSFKKLMSPAHWRYLLSPITRPIHNNVINAIYQNHNVDRHFNEFRRDHLEISRPLTIKQLQSQAPEAQVYMTGSDQVWGGATCNPFYFLDFGDKKTKRVSLSASIGQRLDEISEPKLADMRDKIAAFHAVTLREDEGVKICQAAGREDAVKICDPTILNEAQLYLNLAKDIPVDEGKAFLYYIGNKSSINVKSILDLLATEGLSTRYVTANGEVNRYKKEFLSPTEWLAAIRDAKTVITNSFHGTIFSLLFKKDFIVIPLKSSGANTRIVTLLGNLGLSGRIASSLAEARALLRSPKIDYTTIDDRLKAMRDHGRGIISSILC